MSSYHVLAKTIVDLEAIVAEMKQRLSTLSPCFPDRHCESCPHAAASAATAPPQILSAPATIPAVAISATGPLPAAKKSIAPKKDFGLIQRAFMGEEVYVESHGERWIGTIVIGGISYDGMTYGSPTGFCSAHAARITEKHPQPTDPGSGWTFVKMLNGKYGGKTISFVYEALKRSPAESTSESDESTGSESDDALLAARVWRNAAPAAAAAAAEEAAEAAAEAAQNEVVNESAPVNTLLAQGSSHSATLLTSPSMAFVCMRNTRHTPTQDDIILRGGLLQDGVWKFNSALPDAKSPSGACCAVLKRREGSETNNWDGPRHVLLNVQGTWKPYCVVFPNTKTAASTPVPSPHPASMGGGGSSA